MKLKVPFFANLHEYLVFENKKKGLLARFIFVTFFFFRLLKDTSDDFFERGI